jgi:hypothetical protein
LAARTRVGFAISFRSLLRPASALTSVIPEGPAVGPGDRGHISGSRALRCGDRGTLGRFARRRAVRMGPRDRRPREGLGDRGEATHGFFLHDTTLRVPLAIRPPAGVARPAVRPALPRRPRSDDSRHRRLGGALRRRSVAPPRTRRTLVRPRGIALRMAPVPVRRVAGGAQSRREISSRRARRHR